MVERGSSRAGRRTLSRPEEESPLAENREAPTRPEQSAPSTSTSAESVAGDFREGMLVGLLVGLGHFGGDGKQAQVTIRMHVRHRSLFEWLVEQFPGSRLYGPYSHGGRNYYQWMARGTCLREQVLPVLSRHISEGLDAHAASRLAGMIERYGL